MNLLAQPAARLAAWRRACVEIGRLVGCARTSLWAFDADLGRVTCLSLHDRRDGRTTGGHSLSRAAHRPYFEALLRDSRVVAPHAHSHPATKDLTEDYFSPNGIWSLLDCLVGDAEAPLGIICCEHCDDFMLWTSGQIEVLDAWSAQLAPSLTEARRIS